MLRTERLKSLAHELTALITHYRARRSKQRKPHAAQELTDFLGGLVRYQRGQLVLANGVGGVDDDVRLSHRVVNHQEVQVKLLTNRPRSRQ